MRETSTRMRRGLVAIAVCALAVLMAMPPAALAQQQQQRPAGQPAPAAPRPAQPAAQPAAQSVAKPGEPMPGPVVAVVDIDRIRENSTAAKSVRDQLEKHRSTFQDEISKQENELRNAEQDLNKQRSVLSLDAFNQRRQQFEQRVADVQRQVQSRRRQLETAMANSMTEVNKAVVDAVQEVATSHGANLVLPKSQIILVDKAMELTEDVLTMVNKKLPNVRVTLPAPVVAPTPAK